MDDHCVATDSPAVVGIGEVNVIKVDADPNIARPSEIHPARRADYAAAGANGPPDLVIEEVHGVKVGRDRPESVPRLSCICGAKHETTVAGSPSEARVMHVDRAKSIAGAAAFNCPGDPKVFRLQDCPRLPLYVVAGRTRCGRVYVLS
jgi:hypothetical protein